MKAFYYLIFFVSFSSLFASEVPAQKARFAGITHYAQNIAAKIIFWTCQDIAKASIKFFINHAIITQKILCTVRSYQLTSAHLVDYGGEAAWATVFDGPDKIPHHLIKYAFIEALYARLRQSARITNLDYPVAVKKNKYLYWSAWFLMPIIAKRLLNVGIDCLVDIILADDADEDGMIPQSEDPESLWG